MNTPQPSKVRHEWIPLSSLKVHLTIQRRFDQKWADAIAANFDPDAFGELYVSTDGQGGYLIWDGQHRAAAARKALGNDQQVYCRVHSGEAAATLAARCLKLNTRKQWQAVDTYLVRVAAGDWKARAIHGVLHQFGLRIARAHDKGVVQAVTACDWVIDTQGGPSALERVIRVLYKAWGDDPDAYHHTLIRGVGLVVGRYDGQMDEAVLSDKLVKSGGPARMTGRIRDYAKLHRHTAPRAALEIMRAEYNKGRRGRGLPPWSEE